MNNSDVDGRSEVSTVGEDQANISSSQQDREPGGTTSPPHVTPKDPRSEAQFEVHLSLEEGWVKLSEEIYLCNKEPLKKGANVYRGKKKFGRDWLDVAIKLIPYDETNFEEIQLHLKLEDHPNIIRMYDAREIVNVTRQIYIVMELCPQTLRDFIEENEEKPINFNQRFSYAKQIVAGVAFIHKKNILHRDIKLENILLSPSRDYIRLADFGLSKELRGGNSVISASTQGLGTEGYRAKELFSENPQASFKSDSFALGIVLALLFSNGHHPFGSDPNRWRTNILDNNAVDLSNIEYFIEEHSPKKIQLLDLIRSAKPHQQREYRQKSVTIGVNVAEGGKAIQNYHNSVILIGGKTGSSVNPEILHQNAGVWRDVDSNLKSMKLALDSPPPNNADLKQPAVPKDEAPEENPTMESEGDPIDQYLSAKRRKIEILERESRKALSRNDVVKYSEILDELKKLRDSDDLDMVLKLAEYELMSKLNDSAIETVRNYIFASEPRSALETRKKAKSLYEEKHYVQALILYKISRDLHKNEEKLPPDAELIWIKECMRQMSHDVTALIESGSMSRNVAVKYGTKYMKEWFDEVNKVSDATPHARALAELDCRYEITHISLKLANHEMCIQYGEKGVTMMKKQFNENALRYKVYGMLLNNVGHAYDNLGIYSKAEYYFVEAIRAKEKALDFESEEKRQETTRISKRNLENTRGRLAKYP